MYTELCRSNQLVDSGTLRTIDGANSYKIFAVGEANVTIRNLKIVNGKSANAGGAMHIAAGHVTIDNVVFEGNSTGEYGGALSIAGGSTVTISNSTFKDNSAARSRSLTKQTAG